MNTQITAIYEGGFLKPTAPLSLPEGARVEVIVLNPCNENPKPAAQLLAEIAAMPLEQGPQFSGREHDQVLYGNRAKP